MRGLAPISTNGAVAGSLADQAALFGLLARLRDLGATLLLVERLTVGHRESL